MSHLPYARIGSGARRAMWREFWGPFWCGSPGAKARRVEMEWEWVLNVPYDEEHFPLLSPEPPLNP